MQLDTIIKILSENNMRLALKNDKLSVVGGHSVVKNSIKKIVKKGKGFNHASEK